MKVISLISGILLAFATPLWALQEEIIQVNAQLSESSITQEEVVILGVVISGNTMINKADVRMPTLEEFRIVSQSSRTNTQIINGQVTSALQYLYYLVPRSTGILTIPAIDVEYKGKTYTTDSLQLQVTPAVQDDKIIARMVLDKSSVYVGEQLQFETQLMFNTTIRVSRYDIAEKPEMQGFINIPDPTFTRQERTVIDLNDERYLRFTLNRNILFPLSEGDKRIRGVPFEIQYYDARFGNNIKFAERNAADLRLTVKPLPQPMPEDFTGAVGNYQVRWDIDRTEGKAQEPFTLIVEISGDGDIERIPEPELKVNPHVEVISAKSNVETRYLNSAWGGTRRWEFILVPGIEGEEIIGPLNYSYFNPVSESYETSTTEPIVLNLEPAETASEPIFVQRQQTEIREEDIRYIQEQNTGLPHAVLPPLLVVMLLVAGPIVINVITLLLKRLIAKSRGSDVRKRKRFALQRALKQIKPLTAINRDAKDQELQVLASSIRGYFAGRFDISESAGVPEIRQALKKYELHESESMNDLQRVLNRCAAGRYAPSSSLSLNLGELAQISVSALSTIEEDLK
jgi:hypothetical protein